MKTLTIVLLLTALAASDLFCLLKDSGWNDSTTFKEQKYLIPPISKMKFSADSKRFITYSSDTTVKIWDIETGNLLSEYRLKDTTIVDVDLNENEKWVAIASDNKPSHDPSTWKWHSYIYDYTNDTLIKFLEGSDLTFESSGSPQYTSTNNKILFTNNQKSFLNNFKYYMDFGGDNNTIGINYIFDIDSNNLVWKSNSVIGNAGIINNWKMSKSANLAFCISHDSWWRSQGHGGGSGSEDLFYIFDIDAKIIKKFPTTFLVDFSYNGNYIAYKDDLKNTVNFYNLTDSTVESYINYNNNNPENKLNDIAFSYTNYDLYFSTTNKLYHWSHWTGTIVDSFNLSGANGEVWQLLCSKDGKYLLAASNLGHIRIFDMEKVMSVDDKTQNSDIDGISIFPNPVTDYLSIKSKKIIDKIEIFSILGEQLIVEQTPSSVPNTAHEINVSSFSPGIYFLKAGNKFSKFVKM